eukprot:scaffold256560_cov38-Tisochrysis_lutea.AAC.1
MREEASGILLAREHMRTSAPSTSSNESLPEAAIGWRARPLPSSAEGMGEGGGRGAIFKSSAVNCHSY